MRVIDLIVDDALQDGGHQLLLGLVIDDVDGVQRRKSVVAPVVQVEPQAVGFSQADKVHKVGQRNTFEPDLPPPLEVTEGIAFGVLQSNIIVGRGNHRFVYGAVMDIPEVPAAGFEVCQGGVAFLGKALLPYHTVFLPGNLFDVYLVPVCGWGKAVVDQLPFTGRKGDFRKTVLHVLTEEFILKLLHLELLDFSPCLHEL